MNIYTMYFSPTGRTKQVAKLISSPWEHEKEIDLSEVDFKFEEIIIGEKDVVIIAVPSFGGRVPKIALEHIKKLKGNQAKAVLVVAYGNRAYDDTLLELMEVVEKSDFKVISAVAAVTEHSIMRQYATGRPDAKDKGELKNFGIQIKSAIETKKDFYELVLNGNKPYKEYNGVPFKPKANRDCNKCKICEKQCPVGAIPKEKPNTTDESKCISCMRCIEICPMKARKLNKLMLSLASKKMEKMFEERKNNEIFMAVK